MKEFFDKAAIQNHPLRFLLDFLDQEKAFEQSNNYDEMRFVGYVLEIGYEIGDCEDRAAHSHNRHHELSRGVSKKLCSS